MNYKVKAIVEEAYKKVFGVEIFSEAVVIDVLENVDLNEEMRIIEKSSYQTMGKAIDEAVSKVEHYFKQFA